MKKFLILFLMIMLCLLAGCADYEKRKAVTTTEDESFSEKNNSEMNMAKLNIVCANFPEYDWVRNIIEGSESIDVWLLIDDGTDIHSFQPSVDDMLKVSNCDMFIYAGGENAKWMNELLDNAENENMTVIDMLDFPYAYVISTEHEHDEEYSDEVHVYDEHVWLSLSNAKNVCRYIYECLVYMDETHKDLYEANYESYIARLTELDDAYEQAIEESKNKEIVFADRFPFVYMMDEYGISCKAAFSGCSTETDASFQTIVALSERVDELGLKNIVVLENSSTDVAKALMSNVKSKDLSTVEMNSMQSVSASDIDEGSTYLRYMEENLKSLIKALEVK